MEVPDVNMYTLNLTSLTFEAQTLLSYLLNSHKILLSEGPDKLPRDWRGLARLLNISTEVANSFESDKTSRVINYWVRKADGTATVGKLLEYVQKIDRYDVFDDFMELWNDGRLVVNQPAPSNALVVRGALPVVPYEDELEESRIITYEDKTHGDPQFYHAYVLYAPEDREFVDEMIMRMRDKGLKLCTEENLLPDYSTTYAPVSRLISSQRCGRIILVYSPDFLDSPANNFYMDYAQAISIEMKKPKIIPVMYRACALPPQVTFYHKLYYSQPGNKTSYDFWERLACALDTRKVVAPPRLNGYSSQLSGLNITELTNSEYGVSTTRLLPLPSSKHRSASEQRLDKYGKRYADLIETSPNLGETQSSLSSGSQDGERLKKKRFSIKKYVMKTLKIKAKEEKVAS